MDSDQVAAIVAPAELLTAYHRAVNDHTVEFLDGLDAADYDRVVDEHWDPPVTPPARLVTSSRTPSSTSVRRPTSGACSSGPDDSPVTGDVTRRGRRGGWLGSEQ